MNTIHSSEAILNTNNKQAPTYSIVRHVGWWVKNEHRAVLPITYFTPYWTDS